MRLRLSLPLLATLAVAGTSSGQVTYNWNGTNTDWGTPSSWAPAGPPTATDLALFSPNSGLPFVPGSVTPTTFNQPSLGAAQAALSATFAPTPRLGGWTLTGNNNTLTLGGTGSTGLTTRGPVTTRLTGVGLAGSAAGTLAVNIGGGSELALDGTTALGANLGTTLGNFSGTLTLDNTGTNVQSRLGGVGLQLTGGTLNLLGSGANTYSFGSLTGGNTAGLDVIRVTPGGGTSTAVFANAQTGSNTAFSTRLSTFSVFRYEAGGGATLGATAVISFAGTPGLGANGLLANVTTVTSTSGTFGYALAVDAGGTDFATWVPGSGVVRAGATANASAATLDGITSTNNTTRAQYNPAASETPATSSRTFGSLRITPQANNLTTTLGAGNVITNALMIDGPFDYTLATTGQLGTATGGTRYLYVNGPTAALTTGLQVVYGGNPSTFGGPGFVIFNGTAVQASGNTGANSSNRFDLTGGTVRATEATFGFSPVVDPVATPGGNDLYAALNFRGGVLEIAGGANGSGAAADFRRTLGSVDGQVRWEGGAGGFSAFGSAASVNIGGAASPAALQWAATNFVQDGQALRFGSTRSNAPVVFLNPLQLDNGTAYQLREVNVVGGAGGDRTVLAGGVTGAANADLVKTGTGTLVLPTGSSYAGNTLVQAGTVVAGGTGLGTGRVFVRAGASLYPAAFAAVTDPRPAPTTLGGNGQYDFEGGATLRVRATGAVTPATQPAPAVSGAAGTVNSLLSAGAGGITLGNGTNYVVDLTGTTGLTAGQPYRFQIGTSTGSNVLVGTAGAITFLDNGADVSGSVSGAAVLLSGSGVFLSFTPVPVPEPATVLAVAAATLGGLRLRRRVG